MFFFYIKIIILKGKIVQKYEGYTPRSIKVCYLGQTYQKQQEKEAKGKRNSREWKQTVIQNIWLTSQPVSRKLTTGWLVVKIET